MKITKEDINIFLSYELLNVGIGKQIEDLAKMFFDVNKIIYDDVSFCKLNWMIFDYFYKKFKIHNEFNPKIEFINIERKNILVIDEVN